MMFVLIASFICLMSLHVSVYAQNETTESAQIIATTKPVKKTPRTIFIEELFYQRAAETHMLPTAVDVERQLVSFKIQNNLTELTDQQFEEQLKLHGFTLKSYRRQLGRMIAAENVKRIEISEKIVVTAQEVDAYYKNNPEYTRDEYHLKVCTIAEEQIPDQATLIKENKLGWEDLGWVEKKDIGKNFSAVFSMKPGSISKPIKSDDGYQLVQLVNKRDRHLKTLTERYGDIERHLQDERKGSFLEKIEKEIMQKAVIERL